MDYSTDRYRATAVSWTLHAMKSLLGLKTVRNKVLKYFCPTIENLHQAETFDAFQPTADLLLYCEQIRHSHPYVVFTASNCAEDVAEPETHYQAFYLDNVNKHLYMIDPARKNNADGIYTPFIALDTIQPFYEQHGYVCQFIEMTHPAQSTTRDVFCQSWSLYILLNILQNNQLLQHGRDIHNVVFIPKKQLDRYAVLLDFYQMLLRIPTLSQLLVDEYVAELTSNKDLILAEGTARDYKYLISMDPVSLVMQMEKEDMK
jgi:hypothetical protein